jgi:HPt (histidine-containing phosphotransfer) domain-containing protein
LVDRLGRQEEFARKLVSIFLDEAPRLIQNLKESLNTGDPFSMTKSAHALKGASANAGAIALSETARVIEKIVHEGRIDEIHDYTGILDEAFAAFKSAAAQHGIPSQSQ